MSTPGVKFPTLIALSGKDLVQMRENRCQLKLTGGKADDTNGGCVDSFRTDGLLFPKRILSLDEAAAALAELERYEHDSGGVVHGKWRYKSHPGLPWINSIMRLPQVLDLVEPILGADLMVWTSHLYPKEPGDGRFISWHQDSAHWGLDSDQIVTLWIALTPVNKKNGCMRMLRGTHRSGIVAHEDTWDPDNILTRGRR